jgi:hypothetical protein
MAKQITSYQGNMNLHRSGVAVEYSEDQIREIIRCKHDPVYFIKKYIFIINLDEGLIPFELYDFQEEFVDILHNYKRIISKWGRQSGKTTTFAAYMCHYIIFNESKTAAILANKDKTAREILHRVKIMFENLPSWLKPGVIEWNKSSVEFENGSRILSSATSSSAIRGMSINFLCVPDYTNVCVMNNAGEIFNCTINESNKKSNITQILTQEGFKDFDGFVSQGITNKLLSLKLSNNETLDCTYDHLLLDNKHVYIEAKELSEGDILFGDISIKEIVSIDKDIEVFDALNVKDTHSYITNSLVSHNCLDEFAFISPGVFEDFIQSVYPTVSSSKEAKIVMISTPWGLNHFFKFWTEAEKGVNGYKHFAIEWDAVPGRNEAWRVKMISEIGLDRFNQEFCVHGETFIKIRNKKTNKIEKMSMFDLKTNLINK